jgi:hypothetical protein
MLEYPQAAPRLLVLAPRCRYGLGSPLVVQDLLLYRLHLTPDYQPRDPPGCCPNSRTTAQGVSILS